MWFRRRRRQLPPVLLPPLDRLSELVDRVVTLLDEAPTPAPEPVQVIAERPDEDRRSLRKGTSSSFPARAATGCSHGKGTRRPPSTWSSSTACAFASCDWGLRRCRATAVAAPSWSRNRRPRIEARRVNEESQIDEMRAALRGDRERAEEARRRSLENVRALLETPAQDPEPEPAPARQGLLARLFGR